MLSIRISTELKEIKSQSIECFEYPVRVVVRVFHHTKHKRQYNTLFSLYILTRTTGLAVWKVNFSIFTDRKIPKIIDRKVLFTRHVFMLFRWLPFQVFWTFVGNGFRYMYLPEISSEFFSCRNTRQLFDMHYSKIGTVIYFRV
jgi:hypothetical protein